MKNIHVIQTDKPSRLHEYGYSSLGLSKEYLHWKLAKNIYITSDEEIKEGDWVYHPEVSQEYTKVNLLKEGDERYTKRQHVAQGVYKHKPTTNEWYKKERKIILTTDQDLIKDGVQAIPDEFLEWFVNNPSCEVVEVVKTAPIRPFGSLYKIIIPSEEIYFDFTGELDGLPNLSDVIKEKFSTKEEPKQETLEEFIEKEGYPKGVTQEIWEQGVREGAKWQKEQYTIEEQCVGHTIDELDKEYIKGFNEGSAYQQERSYSEEEVKNILNKRLLSVGIISSEKATNIWFKQYTKTI
jgi:hypothetical protein